MQGCARALLAALVSSMIAAAPVRADDVEDPFATRNPQSSSRAAKLFDEGRDLASQGKIEAACELFAVSWSIERAAGTELNLADCLERQGQLLRAWSMFEQAARAMAAQGSEKRAAFARGRAAALVPRLATVRLRVPQPFARRLRIALDGRALQLAPEIEVHVEPGTRQVVVSSALHGAETVLVEAKAGSTATAELPAYRELLIDRWPQRRFYYLAVGGLAVLGVTGIVVGSARHGDAEARRQALFADGRCLPQDGDVYVCKAPEDTAELRAANHEDAGHETWMYGGVALIAAGVVTYFLAPRDRVTVVPIVAPTSAGVAMTATF